MTSNSIATEHTTIFNFYTTPTFRFSTKAGCKIRGNFFCFTDDYEQPVTNSDWLTLSVYIEKIKNNEKISLTQMRTQK